MEKRYSKYIRPVNYLFDMVWVVLLAYLFLNHLNINPKTFSIFLIVSWFAIGYVTRLYEVYRITSPVEIIAKITQHFIIFALFVIAYFPFHKETTFSGTAIAKYISVLTILVSSFKIFVFYFLKKYRITTGNNYRNVVIIGHSKQAYDLKQIFNKRTDYGYRFKGLFSDKQEGNDVKEISEIYGFCKKEKIDEIYCSLKELSDKKLKNIVEFSDMNNIALKFIPDTKAIFSKNLKVDYYELLPILSLRRTPLDSRFMAPLKRGFDILFSLTVVILILSWLIPVLAILIKIESKGPIFFKQNRPGINVKGFNCYKFRSMRVNKTTEKEASRNDPRVTKIGRFIRKTSIDEMPQFLNVLLGDMSIVGPRPHLWSQNDKYSSKVKKYMVRHYVKPGITGLAQVKGFRGEIETDEDMINRIKYDVFYIENWSPFLDIKIIILTVINIIKGEDKAY